LVALAACTFEIGPPSVPRPDVIYEPDLVGPITEVTHDGITDTYTVTVAGESFDIGPDAASLEGSPGSSDSFLIYGTDGGTGWYASIGIASTEPWAGCAMLYTPDAWDVGDSILFAFTPEDDSVIGILLPKATAWDQTIQLSEEGRYPEAYTDWCIDMNGRVEQVFEGAGD
jgi:hypothetical protein